MVRRRGGERGWRQAMTGRVSLLITSALLFTIASPVSAAVANNEPHPSIGGRASEQEITIVGRAPSAPERKLGTAGRNDPVAPSDGSRGQQEDGETRAVDQETRRWRSTPELCKVSDFSNAAPALRAECDREGQRLARERIECEPGHRAQGALFEQQRSGDGWTVPELVEEESCLDPGSPPSDTDGESRSEVDLPAAAARAFQEMTIEPSALAVQPPDGWTLVNLDTIAYADDEPRALDTDLFGIPVSIRAVPETYTWEWGDGTSESGTDPGSPYPDHTITHAYATPGTATIRLTTTWRGQFRLPGDPNWRDVPGQATTTSESPPIEIHEARTRLVEDLSW